MNEISDLLPDIKLRFNIDHPSYEESYALGYEFALRSLAEEDNPFRKGSPQAEHWLEGWWDASTGEEPLFILDSAEEACAANDSQYCHHKTSFLSLVIGIGSAIAASAIVGYQLFELVA